MNLHARVINAPRRLKANAATLDVRGMWSFQPDGRESPEAASRHGHANLHRLRAHTGRPDPRARSRDPGPAETKKGRAPPQKELPGARTRPSVAAVKRAPGSPGAVEERRARARPVPGLARLEGDLGGDEELAVAVLEGAVDEAVVLLDLEVIELEADVLVLV